jgi:hypothetical protein
MYTNDRHTYRQTFFTVWQKYQRNQPLDAVSQQILEVILLHPEYHALLNNPTAYQNQEFPLEENPFFRMSLHMSIREQIRMDRPQGIALIHQQLLAKYVDANDVENRMMECLAQVMWEAQQRGEAASEQAFLEKLRQC